MPFSSARELWSRYTLTMRLLAGPGSPAGCLFFKAPASRGHAGFDRVSEVYDATRSLRPDVMDAILDGLWHGLRGMNPLLDVGVGTGRFADPLRRLGFEVVGVDLSRRMMTKAREKRLPNLILADAESLPLRSKSFEVAVM